MIRKANEITSENKKIRILIAGVPGIGKTTLALSAPKPLFIDTDLSAERIDSKILRMAVGGVIKAEDYKEVREDLGIGCTGNELLSVKDNLSGCETIVVDTGGNLLNIMGQYGISIDPKYSRRDGSLSLQGYGWLAKEFQRFLDHCIRNLDKHIVIVFHTTEEKDGDDTKIRIKAEGSSKNSVWEVMDLGGFMEIRGDKRTIGFSNCERYFAKGTRGIRGIYTIPELTENAPNDFLTKLFAKYNALSAKEAELACEKEKAYDAAMAEGQKLIATIKDADTANAAMPKLKSIKHALTSELEVNVAWKKKMEELDLFYDKVLKKYTPKAVEKPAEKPVKKSEDKDGQLKLEGSGQ